MPPGSWGPKGQITTRDLVEIGEPVVGHVAKPKGGKLRVLANRAKAILFRAHGGGGSLWLDGPPSSANANKKQARLPLLSAFC